MNTFIKQQCENMKYQIKLFNQACRMAATKDDGKISNDEAKLLRKLEDAGKYYTDVLNLTGK